jgi:hypothetical protein
MAATNCARWYRAAIVLSAGIAVTGCARTQSTARSDAPSASSVPAAATARPASVADGPTQPMASRTQMSSTQDVTIPTDGTATVLGLEIKVVDNTEKRELDGTSFMRVGLALRKGGAEGRLQFTSAQERGRWNDFEIEYRGGWRKEVLLTVRKIAGN